GNDRNNYDGITQPAQPAQCVLEPLIRLRLFNSLRLTSERLRRFSKLRVLRQRLHLLTPNKVHSLLFEHSKENGNQSKHKNPELNVLERLLQPAAVCIVSRKPLPGIVQQFDIRGL